MTRLWKMVVWKNVSAKNTALLRSWLAPNIGPVCDLLNALCYSRIEVVFVSLEGDGKRAMVEFKVDLSSCGRHQFTPVLVISGQITRVGEAPKLAHTDNHSKMKSGEIRLTGTEIKGVNSCDFYK